MQFAEALPPSVAGSIRKNRRIFAGDSIQMFLMIASFMVLGVGYLLLNVGAPSEFKGDVGEACLFGFAGLGMAGILFHRINREFLGNIMLRTFARRQIRKRLDRVVDPDDSDLWFVEEIPKQRWDSPTWDKAEDVGFLRVDHQQGMILFEGDKARYRIPAQSIVRCDQDNSKAYDEELGFSNALVRQWLQYNFVVVTIRADDKAYEASFRILTGRGLFTQSQQVLASQHLVSEIEQMRKGVHTH